MEMGAGIGPKNIMSVGNLSPLNSENVVIAQITSSNRNAKSPVNFNSTTGAQGGNIHSLMNKTSPGPFRPSLPELNNG